MLFRWNISQHSRNRLCSFMQKRDCPEFPLPTYAYEDMAGQNAYIKERTDAGFLCCYNHPYWSLQNYDDYKDF